MRIFRQITLAALAMAFVAATPMRSAQPKDAVQSQIAKQRRTEPQRQATERQDASVSISGRTPRTPLYVKAACAHGCGYSESGERFWKRVWTDPIAAFTAILAVFTIILAGGTLGLWWVTWATLKHARQEFLASYRPQLTVRRIGAVDFGRSGHPAIAKLIIANIGDTSAKIFEIGVDIYVRSKARGIGIPILTGNAEPKASNPIEVPPGKQVIIDIQGALPIVHTTGGGIDWSNVELCALGVVNYTDANEIIRSTGFFRIYHPDGGRFYSAPADDPEADREWEN